MSREKKTRTVEETYYEIGCDFCDFVLESQWDNVRTAVENCDVCGKDFCPDHGKLYYDDPEAYSEEYYAEITACSECAPLVDKEWEQIQIDAKRYEPLRDLVLDKIKKAQNETFLAECHLETGEVFLP